MIVLTTLTSNNPPFPSAPKAADRLWPYPPGAPHGGESVNDAEVREAAAVHPPGVHTGTPRQGQCAPPGPMSGRGGLPIQVGAYLSAQFGTCQRSAQLGFWAIFAVFRS